MIKKRTVNSTSNTNSKKETTKKTAPRQRCVSNDEIGKTAGEVWGLLTENENGQSLTAIKKSIEAPADLVLTAVGWLAREDKLRFVQNGRTMKITLR